VNVDALVVGGGPVGLATAIEARLAGLSVAVVEPRPSPIDKACGECLMPGAVAALDRLGVALPGHPIAGFAYDDGVRRVVHRFAAGGGRGVRRTALHVALAERAGALGVPTVVARVTGVSQDADGVSAAGIRARWLLACDGLHSSVRRLAGLEGAASRGGRRARRYGLRRHFRLRPWDDVVEVHWSRDVEAYVTPVADDLVGVALLGPAGTVFDAALAGLPALTARLGGASADGPVRGAGPLRQRTTRRVAGRVLLVGDASGYVDALTGEGIRVGLAQARVAVACVAAGRAEDYERAWLRATRSVRVLTGGLVAAATSPLRPAIVPTAAALPGVYGAIVERLAR
jgi:flavin-dependent dehydrogenase